MAALSMAYRNLCLAESKPAGAKQPLGTELGFLSSPARDRLEPSSASHVLG